MKVLLTKAQRRADYKKALKWYSIEGNISGLCIKLSEFRWGGYIGSPIYDWSDMETYYPELYTQGKPRPFNWRMHNSARLKRIKMLKNAILQLSPKATADVN